MAKYAKFIQNLYNAPAISIQLLTNFIDISNEFYSNIFRLHVRGDI